MFLDRVSGQSFEEGGSASAPLIVTKDSPRKAFFKKFNRHGAPSGRGRKIRRTGRMVRGNSFAGAGYAQRVVVKINPVKNKTKGVGVGAGSGGANLYHHILYVSRAKAGKDGERAVLFDRDGEDVDRGEFFARCKNDRHHFRMIISPERGDEIEDFEGYVRKVMGRAEKDLGTKLDWVSAVHYDTDDVHAHVIFRGKDERGEDLVIGRDYIAFGLRARAQEIATELLGERSIEDIQRSIEAEVDALRVTSLDRFIEKQIDEDGRVDVRKANNFGRGAHYEAALKGRLRFLESTGLASQHPPGVFALKDGYMGTLYEAGTAKDILNRLHRSGLEDLSDLSIYSTRSGDAEEIEGRLLAKGAADELSDRKYLVIEALSGGKHYVPVGEYHRYDEIEQGALIRVRSGQEATGKADYNIALIARKNDGVYDITRHEQYIEAEQSYIAEEKREGYLDAHRKRLETLEKNEIITRVGEGRYSVPSDLVDQGKALNAQINEQERKRFYPRLDVLSAVAPETQVTDEKVTWLDKELFKRSKGKSGLSYTDAPLAQTLEKRQDWLIAQGYGFMQSSGDFAFRDGAFKELRHKEVLAKGNELAAKINHSFSAYLPDDGDVQSYLGYATLESGLWAATRKGKALYLAPVDHPPEIEKGQECILHKGEKGRYRIEARGQEQARRIGQGRDRDDDTDREL